MTKLVVQLLGISIAAFLIFLFLVPLWGPCWHLLHGDFIYLDGWRVPVPKWFYVTKDQQDRAMWRPTLGIPFLKKAPYGHISLFHLSHSQQPFQFDRDYPVFKNAAIQANFSDGYQLKSESAVAAGKATGYCLHFMRLTDESHPLIRCAVEKSTFLAFYEGDAKYVPAFLGVLQGMSLENSKARAPAFAPEH